MRDKKEALQVCSDFVKAEGIDVILLCPGFTHNDVAEIARMAGKGVAVSVARGDGSSSRVSAAARKREGYRSKRMKE